MNQVETWFGILSLQAIRRGSLESIRALVAGIERFTREWNAGATPFRWVKTPDQILAKAVGKTQADSGAGHQPARRRVGVRHRCGGRRRRRVADVATDGLHQLIRVAHGQSRAVLDDLDVTGEAALPKGGEGEAQHHGDGHGHRMVVRRTTGVPPHRRDRPVQKNVVVIGASRVASSRVASRSFPARCSSTSLTSVASERRELQEGGRDVKRAAGTSSRRTHRASFVGPSCAARRLEISALATQRGQRRPAAGPSMPSSRASDASSGDGSSDSSASISRARSRSLIARSRRPWRIATPIAAW